MEFILAIVLHFLREFWQVLAEMAPYLLFGFIVAGVLKVLLPVDLIERHLGGRGLWTPVKAALLGAPVPLCSCGVIPVATALRRGGASKGATAAFLIATPQTGVDNIAVTYSLLGPLYSAYTVVVTFVSGVVGGWLVDLATRGEARTEARLADSSCCQAPSTQIAPAHRSFTSQLRTMLRYGLNDLPKDIGPALLIGLVLAGIVGVAVPDNYLQMYFGGGIWPMLVIALISIPLYVCSTASVPVAAALIAAGLSPGTALVFLVCGPVTNATTVATLWKLLGRAATLVYMATVIGGAISAGLMLDLICVKTSYAPVAHHHTMLPAWVMHVSAVILLIVIITANWPRQARQEVALAMDTAPADQLDHSSPAPAAPAVLTVAGMSCNHCQASVERALLEQPGVSKVQVDLASGRALVLGAGFDPSQLAEVVTRLGFPATVC